MFLIPIVKIFLQAFIQILGMDLHEQHAGDALEGAANYVQRFILKICEDSDLYYKLKYDPYQPGRFILFKFMQ